MKGDKVSSDDNSRISNFLLTIRVLLILILLLVVPVKALHGQNSKFTFKLKNVTIKSALKHIEKSSEFVFLYYAGSIDENRKVTIDIAKQPIQKVMELLFADQPVIYEIYDRQIILKKKNSPSIIPYEEKKEIQGVVYDEQGSPIIGASIYIKGSTIGCVTDIDGKFCLEMSKASNHLMVSCIGYQNKEVLMDDLGFINITLKSGNELLNEIVVVGAELQKKVSVTGAIASIKGASLKTSSASLTNSLAGRISGVITSANSGEPGAGSTFYIRGISTFGGVRTPLIILDDVEISAHDLNNIPTETIESFSVLKDASATAIYGMRGANGVMLITTKRGMENTKSYMNIVIENGFNTLMNFPDFVDGASWMEIYREAQLTRNRDATPKYSEEVIEATRQGKYPYLYPNVDWKKMIFKNMAINQRANLNLSGGGSKVTYYMSLNFNHDTGLLNSPQKYSWDNNINRFVYNFQNNISYKISPHTKVELNMNAQLLNAKGPDYNTYDLFQMTLTSNPVAFPAYYPYQNGDDHIRFGNSYRNGEMLYNNPYAYMISSCKQNDSNTMNVSLKVSQNLDFITKGLKMKGLVNLKNWSSTYYNRTVNPYYYGVVNGSFDPKTGNYDLALLNTDGTDYIKESNITRSGDRTIALMLQICYQRQWGLNSIGGMLMYMQRDYKTNILPNRNLGFSGRFTYDYSQRYLAELNFGYNGTERLPANKRFELFPAISLGWVISNEKFMNPFRNNVDHLKLRASYGLVGSDQFNYNAPHFLNNQAISLNHTGATFGDDWNNIRKGPMITSYPVLNPSWEHSVKMNVGFDLMMFGSLAMNADCFFEKRSKILMQRVSWPLHVGFGGYSPWSSIGKAKNWGIEFSTDYKCQFNNKLELEFRGNCIYTENKYVYKDEPQYDYPWEMLKNTPLNATWGYVADGLFQSHEEIEQHAKQSFGSSPIPGDIKYRDLNGDNKIDKHDRRMISKYGNMPRLQYGLGLNLTYNKFDFGVFFYGSAMRKIMIKDIHPFLQDPVQGDRNVFQFIADDYWSENNPNPKAAYPRLGLIDAEVKNNHEESTYWMRNGNFVRFKTLELGYSFKKIRLYLNGDNLLVFSPFKLWDPELNWNSYPLQRTFSLGIQLNCF